ncbi:MAG TPA: NADH-ubiquinone oxidoreductase-F iron-sulfur binding region domain-containing protein [Actinoplanes sp.]|nr:NADH-ubiquinone oxidoreductase-F iron-sulfur binding region domain-containing protein [Actinoplanes sp.]
MKPGDARTGMGGNGLRPTELPYAYALGPERLTTGFDRRQVVDVQTHRVLHPPLNPLEFPQLLRLSVAVKLTGRGGAGFPFATKLEAVARSVERSGTAPVVVVNATEGEPASWKDKVLIGRAPHLVLDGAALAAYALQADSIVIGIAEGSPGEHVLAGALKERRMPVPTRLVSVPHRFISGQTSALIRGINGELPLPGAAVRASASGVGGAPTLLSNAETFAQLAVAARLGPHRYAAVGTAQEPGTVLLTVSGAVARPSVVECPAGTPLSDVLTACGAIAGPGVLVGGFHGRWLRTEAVDGADVSRAGLARLGGNLGAGVVIVLGDRTCPLGEAAEVVRYLAGESSGQCGPCRNGLPHLATVLDGLVAGAEDSYAVRAAAAAVHGRGACHHPDGTADFVVSTLDAFPDDLAAHQSGHGCGRPVTGVLPVPRPAGARALRLQVDWTRCDGHGLCTHVAPDLIQLDAHGFPVVADDALPDGLEKVGRRVVSRCPALALRLEEDAAS